MNRLPLNIQENLTKKRLSRRPLSEDDVRLLILQHNSRGYKGKFLNEGQIPIMSLKRILEGCEDYFITHSHGRWNVVIRTPGGIVLFEPKYEFPPGYSVELANRVAKAYSQKISTVSPKMCFDDHSNGYLCINFLETQLSNLVPRF